MLGELVFDATDVVAIGDTDVIVKVLEYGPWIIADLLDLSLEVLTHLLLVSLELISISPSLLDEHLTAEFDGVTSLTGVGDLLLGSVGDAWVRHGVTVIPISVHLEEDGAVLDNVGTSPLDGLLDHEDVLSLDLEAWDFVSASVEVSVVAGSLLGCSHTIGVVLAKIDDGELPKTSHVGSLEELSLVRSTITVHGDSEVLLILVLLGEGESSADGELGADDAIATVVVALSVIVVHGAALASG